MSLARHGSGLRGSVGALGSQVHPVFMLPPVAVSLFGAVLARSLDPTLAALHVTATFCALYTAHVTDGYVDFYLRDEDEDHPLTTTGCRVARGLSSLGFWGCVVALFVLVDLPAALLTIPGWVIAVLHAPQLDTNPVGATVGYPLGVSLTLLGGYYVQAETLTATPLALATVFLVVLSGIKVIDDAQDYDYDRSIHKRTVAVVLGPGRAHRVAYGLMTLGMGIVAGLAAFVPAIPLAALAAPVVFAPVAIRARQAGPELATMLLIRGSYVFLAALVAAVWFRPLA
ncbi:UbiA family prenyltransferase [Halobacteriales archaeon Cl-PHB]